MAIKSLVRENSYQEINDDIPAKESPALERFSRSGQTLVTEKNRRKVIFRDEQDWRWEELDERVHELS
jgi:hypothetical protein